MIMLTNPFHFLNVEYQNTIKQLKELRVSNFLSFEVLVIYSTFEKWTKINVQFSVAQKCLTDKKNLSREGKFIVTFLTKSEKVCYTIFYVC